MASFDLNDDSVVVIVGSGAGGGTLAHELCERGVDCVVLEAGAMQSTDSHVDDEWESFGQLARLDQRTTGGDWRVSRDFPNLPTWICETVGGTTTHRAGASSRIQDHEFRVLSEYGAIEGADLLDWPITLADLEPCYDRAEWKLGVTRTHGIPGLPGNNFKVLHAGATRLGYETVHTGRMAINALPRDERIQCQQLGFCFQGCKMGAKWSTLYPELPRAMATGRLDLRPASHVVRIEHDREGRMTGVVYADREGNQHRQAARVVAVAGNSIESPRLLLNSASSMFPDGLADPSGQVGRNDMRHVTGSVHGVMPEPVHMWRGTTMAGIVQDEAGHDPSRGFAGGYELETLSLGLPFMAAFPDPGAWGSEFARKMETYRHMAGLWIVGEDVPREDNRVALSDAEVDQHGMPVPHVTFTDHPNDVAMREHAHGRGEAIYEAAGASEAFRVPPYPSTHNLGTNRMSARARDGVVDGFGRAHDHPNLHVSDGSVFTTGAAENPTLTIVALAIRQAEHIGDEMGRGEL